MGGGFRVDSSVNSLNIAIVGTATSSIHEAPWGRPDWRIWAVNSAYKYNEDKALLVDLWFDMHHDPDKKHPLWFQWAVKTQPDCVFLEKHPDLKNSRTFPKESFAEEFGSYSTSSIAYMLGLAISAEPATIGIYGVDMTGGGEYEYQRPCCEYFIGMARGKGIDVVVPEASALLKASWLYGYDATEPTSLNAKLREEMSVWRARAIHFEREYGNLLNPKRPKRGKGKHRAVFA